MDAAAKPTTGEFGAKNLLPRWVTSAPGETLEAWAFSSGAALAMLDVALRDPGTALSAVLFRDRLALDAATACLKLEGRDDSLSDIRDAVCLARAGEALGPAGEMFVAWRKVARVNLARSSWRGQVTKVLPKKVAEGMPAPGIFGGSPVAQASQVLADTLRAFPRQEAAALMLADVTLARAVGWDRPVPMFAAHLKRADLRAISDAPRDTPLRVHRAMIAGCDAAIRSAVDLGHRVARLDTIAGKLRAKGAGEALALFFGHDAVSPCGMLSPMIQGTAFAMSDRAARRFCDRLVDLGVVRELTGRATFRLYGL